MRSQVPPPADWAHLADCLRAARAGRSVAEIARASGVSASGIEVYESGRAWKTPPPKLWALVNYYGWTPDSIRIVLAGGLPRRMPEISPETYQALVAQIDGHSALNHISKSAIRDVLQTLVRPVPPLDPPTA